MPENTHFNALNPIFPSQVTMRLPPLPNIQQIIKLYGLSAKQQLSQNFILDLNLCSKFVRQLPNLRGGTIIEIGPGPGGLTRSLLAEGANRVIVIEKDPRFIPALELLQQQALFPNSKESRLKIINADALEIDERAILKEFLNEEDFKSNPNATPVGVIGNLPFAVSTACLIKWVKQTATKQGPFAFGRVPCVLAFQAEVADRIVAAPNTEQYGRLSIMSQQWFHTELGFTIPGKAFVPPPKIDAKIVRFLPRTQPQEPNLTDPNLLEIVAKIGLAKRRKLLKNNFKGYGVTMEELEKIIAPLNLPPLIRPEDLPVKTWARLALLLSKDETFFKHIKPLMENPHLLDAETDLQ